MKFQTLLISSLLIGLVVIALISFAAQTTMDNGNSGNSILNDPIMNSTFVNLNASLYSYQTLAATEKNATDNDPVNIGYGSIILFSVVNAGRIFSGVVINIVNLVLNLVVQEFMLNPIALTVFITIIIAILILTLWRLYRLGY